MTFGASRPLFIAQALLAVGACAHAWAFMRPCAVYELDSMHPFSHRRCCWRSARAPARAARWSRSRATALITRSSSGNIGSSLLELLLELPIILPELQ